MPVLPPSFDRSKLMSLRAYARHRQVSAMTVTQAHQSGRLKASVAFDEAGKFLGIIDPFLADQEWAANTDITKAPPKEQAKAAAREALHAEVRAEMGGAPSQAAPPDEDTLANASAREKHYAAELKKLKYEEEAGLLVRAADVERRLTDVFAACRTRLLAIPSRARQALPALSHADVVVIEDLIREALEDLAEGTERT